MSLKPSENNDDDSFIILGTSPGTSLDIKCDGNEIGDSHLDGGLCKKENGDVCLNGDMKFDKAQLEEALKDMSLEGSFAMKAHFKLGDSPSPASMMVASTMITDDNTTEELQKRFGEILDENVILKETLKQNNDSLKEQFLLIASCQEDMLKTHVMHKEKFEETKELVERLRQENKKLKLDITRLAEGETSVQINNETGEQGKSGPPSVMEFVTSPDDDTVNKLTAQLELVEKQRRQVIVDNETLTWQKESLEHIVDATSKERDDLKEKLKNVELQMLNKESEYVEEINKLQYTIQDLNNKLQTAALTNISVEEVSRRDSMLRQLEAKVSMLQGELKNAQLKILDLENVKLEFTRHKSTASETVKLYKDQLQDLQNRIKEVSTTVFQPVRLSISSERDTSSTEYTSYLHNVKLYDRTLKYLAELLNRLSHGLSDSLVQTLGVVASLYDFKLEKISAEQFKTGLGEVKQQLEKQHTDAVANIGQVKSTLTIFEGIFKDYNELCKKSLSKQEPKQHNTVNVEALTTALVARGQELQMLEGQLNKLRSEKEDNELLKAQLDLYKSDFEAERESREKMASEKENILTDLRKTQREKQELAKQLQELRRPNLPHRPVTSTKKPSAVSTPTRQTSAPAASNVTTGNMVVKKKKKQESEENGDMKESTPPPLRFDCPVCDKSFKTLILLQQHVDSCLG